MKTLITGATGYLGSIIVQNLFTKSGSEEETRKNLILLGHSEKRADTLRRLHGVKVYVGDIKDELFLEPLFQLNDISRIIHTAAIKYVSISNDNPIRTVETNVIGSYNIYRMARKYGINEVISVSTDKAINPINVYGMTKMLMEEMALELGFTVVSGVNFFGSTGSVLDVWYEQLKSKRNLTITDPECIRYFVDTNDMAQQILDSFGNKGVIYCRKVYRVLMKDLLAAFQESFKYNKVKQVGLLNGEKIEEEIPEGLEIIESNKAILLKMIDKWKIGRFE